jgi:hypothetical protein
MILVSLCSQFKRKCSSITHCELLTKILHHLVAENGISKDLPMYNSYFKGCSFIESLIFDLLCSYFSQVWFE